jgi:hypothetical protein
MLAEKSPRRFLPRLLSLVIAAVSFTPAAVRADTPGPLPQGYASDEPAAPAAEADPQAGYQPTQAVQADVAVSASADDYLETDPAALTDFQEPLAPYGTWVNDPTYGTIWVPASTVVGADFAPYQTAGHWELDADSNWMWVSDYEWGSIPFHYGRWVYVAGRGWAWIPGRTYAPAWVNWRLTDYGYIGWAPMGPSWYWFNGAPVSVWVTPPSAYVFCPSTYVFHHHVYTYIVRDREVVQRIGAYSRPYRAAQPGVAHQAASPGAQGPGAPGGGNFRAIAHHPASPSLDEARIPSSAAPQARAQGDARALAFAHRSTTAQAKMMPPPARSMQGMPAQAAREPMVRSRDVHIAPQQPVASAPHFQPAPSRSFTPAPSRSFTPAPSRTFTSAPSRTFTPTPSRSFTPAPSRSFSTPSAPSRSFSTPSRSFSSPSPSRSFSSPSPSRSFSSPSPSRSFSAPSRSFSAPSHSFGGGGHHHR